MINEQVLLRKINESKDDFSHGYVAGYYDCINKIKKLNGLG